jgi:phospholipase/carboxylesterase
MENDAERLNGAIDILLEGMDSMAQLARLWHPDEAAPLIESARPMRLQLAGALSAFESVSWPANMSQLREPCLEAARTLLAGYEGMEAVDPLVANRHFRSNTLAQDALYEAAWAHAAINRFYLPPERRDDAELLARLSKEPDRDRVGVMHLANDREQRGGFSLYVPEYLGAADQLPLVIALHGGSGHGRDFIWAWLKAARAAGVMVLSPTSVDRTWSLMGPDYDSPNVRRMIEALAVRYPIDPSRVLLTGMSDGGTFSTLCGLLGSLPATHVAPFASSFNPQLLELASPARLQGLPFYLVHGEQDWMFPVAIARAAKEALDSYGVRVVYREIAELGHTFPREEGVRVLEWFLAG